MKIILVILLLFLSSTGVANSPVRNQNNRLPKNKEKPYTLINAKIYAYTSLVSLTDSTPCIAANGRNICERQHSRVIANNCLPFGSVVSFGNLNYIVFDKMASRYDCNTFDVYLETYNEAIKHGVKNEVVKVYN